NVGRELPELTLDTVPQYEALFDPDDPRMIRQAVRAPWEASLDHYPDMSPEETTLLLAFDLTQPRELPPPLAEEPTRAAVPAPHTLNRRRRRVDKVDSYLRVYDLAERGQTFGTIAASLGERPSTVKSAFLAARRSVYGLAAAPAKQALPLVDFDYATHISSCATCSKAESFDQMCARARQYALQDHRGQHELTGLDTVSRDIAEDSATTEP